MKNVILFILTLNLTTAFTQDSTNNIYSGGMLILQPGYIIAKNKHQNISNYNFGVGGILRIYFFNYLTAGIYGGTQRAKYVSSMSDNSYINMGYGGSFFGLSKKTRNLRYTFSAFFGRGTIRNLHIESQTNNKLTDAYFYKKSTFVFSPVLSLDYAISQRLNLTLQTVCFTAKFDPDKAYYNPMLQLGILFNR